VPVSTARHCRYLAFGLVIGEPSPLAYGPAQSLHASSGVLVLPDRLKTSTFAPAGTLARQPMTPQLDTNRASLTSDSYVPRAARVGDIAISNPGFAVTT
jgi:hypothetical protein